MTATFGAHGDITGLLQDVAAVAAQPDAAFDLAETALRVARLTCHTEGLDPYREHLSRLAEQVRDAGRLTTSAAGRAAVLATVLHDQYHYSGDAETYDDLDNANLIRVIQRRRGLPVALGVLYIASARRAGWQIHGLAFPGHFLIRLDGTDGSRAIIDPFGAGRCLEAVDLRRLLTAVAGAGAALGQEHYAPVPDRTVLVRLLNNIRLRRIGRGELAEALAVLDVMLLVDPENTGLLRDHGILNLRLGNLRAGVSALQAFVDRAPDQTEAARIGSLLEQLRTQLN